MLDFKSYKLNINSNATYSWAVLIVALEYNLRLHNNENNFIFCKLVL